MNVLQNVRSRLSGYFQTKETPKLENVSLLDVYLENIMKFFSKKYAPKLESFWVVQLSAMYLLLLLRKINFYGFVAILALVAFTYDWLYREKLYAAYTGEYRDVQQAFRTAVQNFIHYLCTLRKESQHIFYPLMVLFFWGVYHAREIQKVFFYLLCLIPVLSVIKHGVWHLPEPILSKIQQQFESLGIPGFLDKEDYFFKEFVIDLIKKHFDNQAVVSDKVTSEQADSFISGLSSMPSYLEVVEPAIEIEEEDLMPQTATSGISVTPGDLSSDSDTDSKDIKFDSNHFNTSSSEDDLLIKSFPTIAQVPVTSESVGMFRSVMNTVGSNIVANMFQSAVYSRIPETRRQVSSESDSSDFELVNAEDIDNDMKKNA